MKICVTGSSSHLAYSLLPRLCALPHVEGVTGIDPAAPHYAHPKFVAERLDIRDPRVAALLGRHDALVHLAFVVLRGRMSEEEMFDVNVTGSHRLVEAARRAGVRRLVHLSSAAVYGGGTNLSERTPFNPLPGFRYAGHKVQLEELLARDVPECVRLRPHVILGPHAQPLLKWLLHQPCYVRLPEPQPLLQCVHEDDVAQAIVLALAHDVSGPFNLAAEDRFSFRDAIRRRHRLGIPLPLSAARAGARVAWRLWGWGGEPAWVDGLGQTLILDCRRAHSELGWKPRHDAHSMLTTED